MYGVALLRAWADLTRALIEHYADAAVYKDEETAENCGIWPILSASYYGRSRMAGHQSAFNEGEDVWVFHAEFILSIQKKEGDLDFSRCRTDQWSGAALKQLDELLRKNLQLTLTTVELWILDPMAFLSSEV